MCSRDVRSDEAVQETPSRNYSSGLRQDIRWSQACVVDARNVRVSKSGRSYGLQGRVGLTEDGSRDGVRDLAERVLFHSRVMRRSLAGRRAPPYN